MIACDVICLSSTCQQICRPLLYQLSCVYTVTGSWLCSHGNQIWGCFGFLGRGLGGLQVPDSDLEGLAHLPTPQLSLTHPPTTHMHTQHMHTLNTYAHTHTHTRSIGPSLSSTIRARSCAEGSPQFSHEGCGLSCWLHKRARQDTAAVGRIKIPGTRLVWRSQGSKFWALSSLLLFCSLPPSSSPPLPSSSPPSPSFLPA